MVGARRTLAPAARASAPIASPTRRSRDGSHVAPRAIATGNAVEGPAAALTPRGPSIMPRPGMSCASSPGTLQTPFDGASDVPRIRATFSFTVRALSRRSILCSTAA